MSLQPAPKLISARYGKFMLNCFPPLLFQRIRIEEFSDDFRYCRIRVKKSFLSRNLHGAARSPEWSAQVKDARQPQRLPPQQDLTVMGEQSWVGDAVPAAATKGGQEKEIGP